MADLIKKKHTPPEYSTVCPYLLVDDIEKQVSFLQKVFGAPLKEEEFDEDDRLMHAEVVIGEVVIMMGLTRPTPNGSELVSSFEIPKGGEGKSWAHPVVCGGRLYIRHGDFLYAYDVRR